jgi:hypothetical protein
MNKQQNEFALKMLDDVLEILDFPREDTKILRFPRVNNPDEVIMVVTDGENDLISADCQVWGDGEEICGGIILDVTHPRERLSFYFRKGTLSVMEVLGHA